MIRLSAKTILHKNMQNSTELTERESAAAGGETVPLLEAPAQLF